MVNRILFTFYLLSVSISAQELLVKFSQDALYKSGATPATVSEFLATKSNGVTVDQIKMVAANAVGTPLENMWHIRLPSKRAADKLLTVLQQEKNIQYIQANHVFRIEQTVINDSLFEQQWGLAAVHANEAWERETGRSNILLAVIDTGIDYRHPDLAGQIWLNSGEDTNNNGEVDSLDFNGIDDDGNGYIDDIRGWDFTDAPRFIDSGDYNERDNDPDDEHGHGTLVSGIIAAKSGNKIGIAGLAPGCRIMNLRAGTSLGYLEEDDVAAAIVYAVKNGARVINMSFGDLVVSPMLRDVIRYAYENGVVLVASSGNSAVDVLHYPSGFAETISVGATQENGSLAGFSNFGATVDVVAPGSGIWSTKKGGTYSLFDGTSAAAPFVTALAGLLLSMDDEMDAEVVRHIITSSAEDLGDEKWDQFFAAGQIHCAAALRVLDPPIAELLQPGMDTGTSDEHVPVLGTAAALQIEKFVLSYGMGSNPVSWTTLASVAGKIVVEDTLFLWDTTNLADTSYTVRLQVSDQDANWVEDKIRVFIDRSPPQVSQISAEPMIDGDHRSALLTVSADDECTATLFWRENSPGTSFEKIQLDYETNFHQYNFSELMANGQPVQYYFELKNKAGLQTIVDNSGLFYPLSFEPVPVNTWQFEKTETSVGVGLLFDKLTDFDADGYSEVITSEYDSRGSIGALKIYEWQPDSGFVARFSTEKLAIPRDVGDTDGDGLYELLIGAGAVSRIFEESPENVWQPELSWENDQNFWAARFSDLDKDAQPEIIARVDDEWQVWEFVANNKFAAVASLPNPTAGGNTSGVPHAEIADYDGDGRQEILFGDYDGDIYIYENAGNDQFVNTWFAKQPLLDSGDFITSGDFDNDGRQDFAVATHSDPAASSESQFDSRRWFVRIYTSTADNVYSVLWQEQFFGYYPVKEFDSGIGAGDLDQDGGDELLVCLFPNAYVLKYVPDRETMMVQWHAAGAKSNRVFQGDKGDGKASLFFNGTKHLLALSPIQTRPPLTPPRYVQFEFKQNGSILLNWPRVEDAEFYRIYRGKSAENLTAFADIVNPPFIDSTNNADAVYYRIASGVMHPDTVLSHFSPVRKIEFGEQAHILSVDYFHPDFITVSFSQKMDNSAKQVSRYNLLGVGAPQSVVLAHDNRAVVLTFSDLVAGSHTLQISDLATLNGMPVITDSTGYQVNVSSRARTLYMTSGFQQENGDLSIQFNQPVQEKSATSIANYRISPELKVERMTMENESQVIFAITEENASFVDTALVKIIAENVVGLNGEKLRRGIGDRIQIPAKVASTVAAAVYPNPFVRSNHASISLINLKSGSTVKVYDVLGRLVFKDQLSAGATAYSWDVRAMNKKTLSSGVYFVQIISNSGKKQIKKIVVLN